MKTAIIITLLLIAALGGLGAVAHDNPARGRNSAIIGIFTVAALACIVIFGG